MDLEWLPQAILFLLFFTITALGLWLLGVWRRKRIFKQLAVFAALFPVLGGVAAILNWSGVLRTREFHFTAVFGPVKNRETDTSETKFQLNEEEVPHRHEIELIPEVWGGTAPSGMVRLSFVVTSPKGEVLVEGDGSGAPVPEKLRWASIRCAFAPREVGEYKLVLKVPDNVGSVNIWLREK
jgi:hypothetical protein